MDLHPFRDTVSSAAANLPVSVSRTRSPAAKQTVPKPPSQTGASDKPGTFDQSTAKKRKPEFDGSREPDSKAPKLA